MVTISFNEDEEMMKIEYNGREVFYGNYWDFSSDPHHLRKFLEEIDMDVQINSNLKSADSDGEDYEDNWNDDAYLDYEY